MSVFFLSAGMSDIDEQAKEITEILETIPATNKAVMKYLFKFLNLWVHSLIVISLSESIILSCVLKHVSQVFVTGVWYSGV